MSQFELGLRNRQAALETLVEATVVSRPRRRASMACVCVDGGGGLGAGAFVRAAGLVAVVRLRELLHRGVGRGGD